MPKTKLNIIKPALAVNQMPDGDLLGRLNAVHNGMLNNPAYPNPLVEHHPTSKICRSIRLVCVGPVMMRSPVAFRKLKESLERRKF